MERLQFLDPFAAQVPAPTTHAAGKPVPVPPRKGRGRWYCSTLLVLSIGTLIAMIVLVLLAKLTLEEVAFATVAAFLALLGAILTARHLKQLPREFRLHEDRGEYRRYHVTTPKFVPKKVSNRKTPGPTP